MPPYRTIPSNEEPYPFCAYAEKHMSPKEETIENAIATLFVFIV
jgi:hypothetical protein